MSQDTVSPLAAEADAASPSAQGGELQGLAAGDAPASLPAEILLARKLLGTERFAVFSTLSIHLDGYPYGSVTPYALSARGLPLLLISSIAAHTQNVRADPRSSLFVQEHPQGPGATLDGWDPQALGRMTLMGRTVPVPEAELGDARARYLARVPQAEDYFGTHDFAFYQLEIERVRLIGGFGKISWVEGKKLWRDPAQDPLAKVARGILEHMNDDHGEALSLYCKLRQLPDVTSARMVGVDAHGFDVVALPGDRRLRFDFAEELTTTDAVRRALVALVGEARRRLAG